MTLVSVTAYHSFSGEVEALNTPTIRRLTPSCRHQLPRITRVQEHDADAKMRKLVLDFIILHHAMVRDNFLEQQAKFRNIPLPVTQCVKEFSLCLLGAHLECRIEGAARSNNAQPFVEYNDRFADCIDDALGQCAGVYDIGKLLSEIGFLHKFPQGFGVL